MSDTPRPEDLQLRPIVPIRIGMKPTRSILCALASTLACSPAPGGSGPGQGGSAALDIVPDAGGGRAGSGGSSSALPEANDPLPRVATTAHLDLSQIERISRFRSGIGHDYGDSSEHCRSMKHYLCPTGCSGAHEPAWTELEVRSPVDGTIERTLAEQTYGTQIVISVREHPELWVKLFHVAPDGDVTVGASVTAGQRLGHHATDMTMSDVAVERHLRDGFQHVSFFELLSDAAFAELIARGVPSREALQISAAERDADPLTCDGEAFASPGTLQNWVDLD